MKKIIISGYHGFQNMGDDAILESTLQILHGLAAKKGDQLEITVLSQNPQETSAVFGIKSVKRTNPLAIFKAIRASELFISGGGSLLQDKTGYGLSVLYYLGLVYIAHLLGKPVVLYAHGVGPITKKINRRLASWILNKVDLITVRDTESKEELTSLGVNKPPIYVTVDPVFFQYSSGEAGGAKVQKIIRQLKTDGPLIGVSVREWMGEKQFLQEIAQVADQLAETLGAQIIVIPMFPDEDTVSSQEVVNSMKNKAQAQVIEANLNAKELLALFSHLDMVIGIRLHSLVFAAITAVPMVGIGYDPKIFSLLSQLGMESAGRVEALQADQLMEKCFQTWEKRDIIRKKLTEVVGEFRRETINCGAMIYNHFFPKTEKTALKVLHLISGGDTGGAKKHVLSLVHELQKKIDVTLVVLMEGEFYREGLAMGLNIRTIEQKYRANLSVVRQLIKLIKEEGIQVLHCHGARANFIGAILKRYCSIPAITTMHSDYKLDFLGDFYKSMVYTPLNAVALRSFDYYIAISDNFKEMMIERGFEGERIFVVYNGVDFNEELSLSNRREVLEQLHLDIPAAAKIVGIMGRLHPVKGHDLFIKTAQHVVKEEPNTHFIIAGDGEERDNLLALRDKLGISDKVHLVGHVQNPDEFVNIVDVNVLTSLSESFPYVLLEGARQKKPTISTAVGGISRLIKDGKTGFLVHSRDELDFAAKLLELLTDEELAKTFGENIYQHAQDNYSLERIGENHLDIYNKIR